jgi:uncharacterized protein YecE (DUF72 family)
LDATFYEKFYKYMTKDTFRTMTKVTPDNFQFSIKVPEIVTHDRRLDVKSGAVTYLEEFLSKISPLKTCDKDFLADTITPLNLEILRGILKVHGSC